MMAVVKEADILENWEEADEAQLERRVSSYLAGRSKSQNRPTADISVVYADEEPLKGQFAAANAAPSVKILKRPSPANGSGSNGDARQRPVKTFQQRQQDYEAARLRILGEARCPEDTEQMIPNLQIKTDTNRLQNPNKPRDKLTSEQSQIITPNILSVQPRLINPPPANGISLLRTPKGPDNSKGFNLRR